MKVNAKVLGIKDPVTVKSTTHNVKKSFEFQAKVTKNGASIDTNASQMAQLNQHFNIQLKNIGLIENYVTDMLHLNAKNKAKLDAIKYADLLKLSDTIASGVLQYNKDDAQKGKK